MLHEQFHYSTKFTTLNLKKHINNDLLIQRVATELYYVSLLNTCIFRL